MIVMIHGGPHGAQGASFTFKSQFYASRGWATLQVNYRGSTSYGQKFSDAVYGDQNGMEAMEWLMDGNHPNLIVSDLNMPLLDGIELLQNIRASGFLKNIPVIIVSCDYDPEKKRQCMLLGAYRYVMKPFNPDLLVKEIGRVLLIENMPKSASITLEQI